MEKFDRKHTHKVSIIIPCREVDAHAKRCIQYCRLLPYRENYSREIIIIPDSICPGFPATKRNYGMQIATGDIFAFIDSDAYPAKDWLDRAMEHLQYHPAVCGPGVLPPDAPLHEKAADLVLQLMPYGYRVAPKKARICAEFPTFNLVVWRKAATPFENYLTGEDSLFCRKIKEGIYYSPDIIVYHSRRPLWRPFWKQVSIYGQHRGHFIRLALIGWISINFTYVLNFFRGLFMKEIDK